MIIYIDIGMVLFYGGIAILLIVLYLLIGGY